jgi:hypothetical protein
LSFDPTYTVPSGHIATADVICPPVLYVHTIVPVVPPSLGACKAYKLPSFDPTYTIPFESIDGYDDNDPELESSPICVVHNKEPFDFKTVNKPFT